jgi:hypothetical protein
LHEHLNILADAQATLGLEFVTDARICNCITPIIMELWVNLMTITSHYATHLHQQAAGSEDFFLWFCTNYQWTTTMINFVDWDAHFAATCKLSFLEKRSLTKFNFQWLPTSHPQHKVDSAQSTVLLEEEAIPTVFPRRYPVR